MRDYTSANTKRAKQAHPLKRLEGTPFVGCAGGAGPGLIVREATLRGGALNRPSGVSAGSSRGQIGTNLRQVIMGADNAPRVANLAGRGDAATVGDVAAGEGGGVARVAA